MAVRKVELRLSDPGFEEVRAHLRELSDSLDKIKAKFDELSKKVATPRVDVKGLTETDAELDKLNAKLDELSHKRVTAHVGVNVDSHALRRDAGSLLKDIGGGGGTIGRDLAGAAGAGGGGTASGLLSSLGGANNQYTGGLIGALIAYAATIAPAIIPFGLGLGFGGGAAGGALALGSRANKQLQQLAQSLSTGKGSAAKNAPILAQMRQIRQRNAPELQTFGAFQALGHDALSVFNQALTSKGPGFSGGPGGHPGTSFLEGLTAILKGIAPFLKEIGPMLGQIFRASLPSVEAFMKIMLQLAKAVLPGVLQVLKQLNSSGAMPILVRGFRYLSDGIAGFIKNLGPGIKDSAVIFKTSMMIVGATLRAIGSAATGFAILLADVGHGVMLFAKLVEHWFDDLTRNAPSYFTQMGHDIEHIWDSFWHYTIGSVIRGVGNVIHWFSTLPGGIMRALRGLASGLYGLGKNALTALWDGMKSIGGDLLHWATSFITSLPGKLLSALHMSPPHPGSAFYDVGANIMHHFEAGLQSRAHRVSSAIRGAIGHGVGATAGGIQNIAFQLAKSMGWGDQWGAINAVAMRESGWSMTARNPSSGAYGIAQFINGPGEYYQYGGNPNTAVGQITAFYNYMRQRYGSPAAAWAHEMRFGWYDQGGVLKQGLTMALNTSGHDEYISTGPHGGGGTTINIYQLDDSYSDAKALRAVKLLRTYKTRHGNLALNL